MALNSRKAEVTEDVTAYQLDALREYLSMGVGHAAATLNSMLGKHIELEVPKISLIKVNEIETATKLGTDLYSTITLSFDGNIKGNASVIFDKQSASGLIEILMPGMSGNSAELDEISESTLTEIGNIVINSVMGSFSNSFEFELQYQVPRYSESSIKNLCKVNSDESDSIILFGETFLIVENVEIKGKILLFYVLDDLKTLISEWKEP